MKTIDKIREKTHEMCDELRLTTKDQVKKWQKFFWETENMLKKLEIWRLNLHHLFKKVSKGKDAVLGVELVSRNLESSLLDLNQKIKEPFSKMELKVKYSDLWQELIENLQTENLGLEFWILLLIPLKLKLNGISRKRTQIVGFERLLSATNIIICFLLTA